MVKHERQINPKTIINAISAPHLHKEFPSAGRDGSDMPKTTIPRGAIEIEFRGNNGRLHGKLAR